MLTVKRQQIEEMSARLARRFEDAMVEHLETFFPERCAELGPEGVRGAIAYALARAAQYDITSERDVCKFLNMMFVYGFSFDVDPELPWARAILDDASLNRSSVKMYLLMKAANGTLEPPSPAVTPPTDEEIEAALKAAAQAEAEEQARAEAAARESTPEGTGGDDGKPQR